MLQQRNKITLRQMVILYLVSTLSPMIRIFPTECARFAQHAGWLAPVLSIVPLYLIFLILDAMFKKGAGNLSDVIELAIGKVAGKVLIAIYLLWSIILFFVYIRYYAERLLTSIFPNADIQLFLIIMSLIVLMAVRGKFEALARFSEIAFWIFTFVILLFAAMLVPSMNAEHLLPVTHRNIIPIAKATYPIVGIWCYITMIMFLGDRVISKGNLRQLGKQTVLFRMVMDMIVIASVIGSVGCKTVQRMPLPFFNAAKQISIMGILDRIEAIVLAVWVASDFLVICVVALVVMNIIKSLFKTTTYRYYAAPVVAMGYVGSRFLALNRFELELFTKALGLSTNIILFFGVPLIVLIIGKLRKTL